MMRCIDVRETLSMYIDDELGAAPTTELEEHLANCAECMQEYDELSKITMLLRSVQSVSVPASFDEKLRQSIKEEKTIKMSEQKKRWRRISAVAAVFVIGIFSITMYNHMDYIGGDSGGGDAAPMAGMSELSEGDFDDGMSDDIVYGTAPNQLRFFSDISADNDMTSEEISEMGGNFWTGPRDSGAGGPTPETMRDAQQAALSTSENANVTRGGTNQNDGPALSEEEVQEEADYYLGLIWEELRYYNYRVMDYWRDADGVWTFEVEFSALRELEGMVTEVYIYSGQDRELWKKDL